MITDSDVNDTFRDKIDVLEYLQILWRWKWIIILSVVPFTALVIVASLFFITPEYESSTRLLQQHLGVDSAFLGTNVFQDVNAQPERYLETSAELVKSPEVVTAVWNRLGSSLGGMQEQDLAASVRVQAVKDLDIIEITGINPDPGLAANIADAFGEEYISWRSEIDKSTVAQAIAPIEQQKESTPQNQRSSPEYTVLLDKLETLKLVSRMQLGNIQIVNRAVPSPTPASPRPMRNGAIALISTLFVGIGLAVFVNSRFDRKIRNVKYVTSRIDKPVLASVPRQSSSKHGLITISHPASSNSEAYRLLRSNLQFLNPGSATKKILVTSPGPLSGKSTTIANLAVTLARGGKTVTVLEFDFRRPSLAGLMGLQTEPGLTNVIVGTHKLEDVIQVIPAEGLVSDETFYKEKQSRANLEVKDIMCAVCGPIPPNPGELVATDATRSVIEEAATISDYVLIDSPPMGIISDAAPLTAYVDGVICIVRMSLTDQRTFDHMLDTMENSPARILGVVITDADVGGASYYGNKYEGEEGR